MPVLLENGNAFCKTKGMENDEAKFAINQSRKERKQ